MTLAQLLVLGEQHRLAHGSAREEPTQSGPGLLGMAAMARG